MPDFQESNSMGDIAIIGMNGRFPGAKNLDDFWKNLYEGVESVKFFNRDELIRMGIDEHLLDNPKFVAADAILEDMDLFDASFFDYSAREAEIMDPQHRLFLESAWEVLESARYNSELYKGRVAVYAGANLSGYMVRNLYSNPGLVENLGSFKIMIANGQDFLATKVSYKMNLTGPSVNVNTLCSSSMVALHYACQNLLNYGCDIALAGGVSFQVSRNEAFFYQEGGIGSSDGHCRAFDSKANGTVSGSGLAVVVLKRLEDAIADGDTIHAVIKGTGINNDGAVKNSYTAPNVDGQAECIAEAIAMSGVNPETISYIDAHGTGTDLGDPIEIAALTKVYRTYTPKKQFCAIGSAKTNIGHLVNAGGMASLVKTVLAMKHRTIPASLNFEEPNPKIDFINSPFYVNTKLSKWETDGCPLRAGVSSFGIGGTNTHVILEEAPAAGNSEESKRPWQLVILSAKTETALEKMSMELLQYIRQNKELNPADIAFTLQVGRRSFNYRRIIVCRDLNDLADKLERMNPEQVISKFQKPKEHPVVFMLPGEENGYINMGRELYRTESVFRNAVDQCAEILKPVLGADIRHVLYPADASAEESARSLKNGTLSRTAVFTVEYAMAQLWRAWEVTPQYMVGVGTGEYVAACLSGVLSLEDALLLLAAEGELRHEKLRKIKINDPEIPYIACTTGEWIKDAGAVGKEYWLREKTSEKMDRALLEILEDSDRVLIEIGPGKKMCTAARKLAAHEETHTILSTMPASDDDRSGSYYLAESLGYYWLAGGNPDWNKLLADEKRHRIPLPTYPFERQRYWIEAGKRNAGIQQPDVLISGKDDITEEIAASKYKEGVLTITLDLEENDGNEVNEDEHRNRKLEELVELKTKLEALCGEFYSISPKIDISPVGLRIERASSQDPMEAGRKLKKSPRPDLDTPYVAPETQVEKVIAQKWQDVLGYERIGVNDDFFVLGGHSLIAAAVASELSKVFDVQISLRELFETTTIAQIAELIETYRWTKEGHRETAVAEEREEGSI